MIKDIGGIFDGSEPWKGGNALEQLDYLWNYQELDLKMDELNAQKKDSPLRKELYRSIRYLKNQQKNIEKLNNDIDKKNHIYNRILHEFESINSVLKQEEEILNSGDVKSFKQLDQVEKKILEAEEKLKEKKEELTVLLQDMNSLNKKLQAITSRLQKGKKEYEKNKKEYDLAIKELDSQYKDLKAKRDRYKVELNNALLKRYEAIKNSHPTVMAEIEQDRCGGCNMALASLVIQNVKDKGRIIECENCGRILYSRKEESDS